MFVTKQLPFCAILNLNSDLPVKFCLILLLHCPFLYSKFLLYFFLTMSAILRADTEEREGLTCSDRPMLRAKNRQT